MHMNVLSYIECQNVQVQIQGSYESLTFQRIVQ